MKTENLPEQIDVPMINGVFVPENLDQTWRLANMYSRSGIVPTDCAGNPQAIIVKWQLGSQLGLSPMASMQNISSIHGTPTIWGDVQKALIQESGEMEVFVEFFEGKYPNDDFKAVCISKRKDEGMEYDHTDDLDTMRKKGIYVNEFSVADAKTAGLWGGTGKPDKKKYSTWAKHPKRMMKMRARSYTLRDGYPGVLKGMHTSEEMIGVDDAAIDVTPTVPKIVHADAEKEFSRLIFQKDYDHEHLDLFIQMVAKSNGSDAIGVMESAVENFDGFWTAFENWSVEQPTKEPPEEDAPEAEPTGECVGVEIPEGSPPETETPNERTVNTDDLKPVETELKEIREEVLAIKQFDTDSYKVGANKLYRQKKISSVIPNQMTAKDCGVVLDVMGLPEPNVEDEPKDDIPF